MTEYVVVEYQFGSGQTIEAAIKLVNHQSIVPSLMIKLLADYKTINGGSVPKLGETVYIPVFPGFVGMSKMFTVITIEV